MHEDNMKKILITFWITLLLSSASVAYSATPGGQTIPQGGTGNVSYTAGDIIYSATTGAIRFTPIPIGSNGNCLGVSSGIPSYIGCVGLGSASKWATSSSDTSAISPNSATAVGIGTTNPREVNANSKLTIAGIGAVDVVASSTDNTTLSTAIIEAYAPGSRIFMGAHGTNQITTQYGITVGGWAEIGAINSSLGTLNGLLLGTRTTATPIIFGTNSVEAMRITSGQNVGVGTSTPYTKLTVWGPGTTTAESFEVSNNASTTNVRVWDNGTVYLRGNVGVGSTTPATLLSVGTSNGINFTTATTTFNSTGGINIVSGCYSVLSVCIPSNATSTNFWYANGTAIYNANSGKVGIGTRSPNGQLTVVTPTDNIFTDPANTGSSALSFYAGTGAVTDMGLFLGVSTSTSVGNYSYIQSVKAGTNFFPLLLNANSGKVNVGTSSIQTSNQELFVSAPDNNTSVTFSTVSGVGITNTGQTNNNTSAVQFNTTDSLGSTVNTTAIKSRNESHTSGSVTASMFFNTINSGTESEKMRLTAAGNFGIGTTTPGTALGVQGNMVAAGFINSSTFSATSTTATSTVSTGGFTVGTSQFVVQQSSGNIGIGTTSPFARLSVSTTAQAAASTFLFQIASTTAANLFLVDANGHIQGGGSLPTVSSCGTSPSVAAWSSDTRGEITIGGGVVTTCTIVFSSPRSSGNYSAMADTTSGVGGGPSSKSSTSVTFTFTGTVTGAVFDYWIIE